MRKVFAFVVAVLTLLGAAVTFSQVSMGGGQGGSATTGITVPAFLGAFTPLVCTTSSCPAIKRNTTGIDFRAADDSGYTQVNALEFAPAAGQVTAGSGTGVTVVTNGVVHDVVYKVTVTSANFIANATTADVTIATLPAKTAISAVIADQTQTFACSATCTTATLSMTCGKTAGGNEYLLSWDSDAATGQFGITQATIGAALKVTTPPAMLIGDFPSWTTTTAVQCRLTSGTGNIGTGAATNLSQGSVTFYLITTRLP